MAAPAARAAAAVSGLRRNLAVRRSRAGAAIAPRAAAAVGTERPGSAECARTLVLLAETGTLSTSCSEDGFPLGTLVGYVLGESGQPLLRLRADALHTANIAADPRCSLFVQPDAQPAGVKARATLLGKVVPLEGDAAEAARARFEEASGPEAVGVDLPAEGDMYMALDVDRVFYVGGLGTDRRAEVVASDVYAAAEPDALASCCLKVAADFNETFAEDVMRFALTAPELAGVAGLADARIVNIDAMGFDVRGTLVSGDSHDVRINFPRLVTTAGDARSTITMLSQELWEELNPYTPAAPPPLPEPEEATA